MILKKKSKNARPGSALLIAILILCAGASAVHARWVWTARTGWVRAGSGPPPTARELYAEAMKAYRARRFDDAIEGFEEIRGRYPDSPEARETALPLAESAFHNRDYEEALEAFDRILEAKPEARVLDRALWRKYQIGLAFLSGAKRHFLGIPYAHRSYGAELLDKLTTEYPFKPFSDDALLEIGHFYFRDRSYEDAETVYERLIRNYPESEWFGTAEFYLALSARRRIRSVDNDPALVREAMKRFRRYLADNREGTHVPEANRYVKELHEMEAEHELRVARFYGRLGKPKAARIYYEWIVGRFPGTPAREEAEAWLRGHPEEGS
ncbi:MAG: outer membrane protein assembly factor BamD [Planctomycetes bacterium]|nr:outer membrane protein assembly factor BamD [Planctomycetota bacterium]